MCATEGAAGPSSYVLHATVQALGVQWECLQGRFVSAVDKSYALTFVQLLYLGPRKPNVRVSEAQEHR